MDVEAELKVARMRAVALANARVDAMHRSLRRDGAEDRRIIREAAGLPEPVNPFDAAIEAVKTFVRQLLSYSKRDYARAR